MDKKIVLEATPYRVVLDPSCGMRLESFQRNGLECIRPSDKGSVIGPHFQKRHERNVPSFAKDQNATDSLVNGVAAYAPWSWEGNKQHVVATLKGSDVWKEHSIEEWEGQSFRMEMEAQVNESGFFCHLNVISDADSLIGYAPSFIVDGENVKVTTDVKPITYAGPEQTDLTLSEYRKTSGLLDFVPPKGHFSAYQPFRNALSGEISVATDDYRLRVHYSSLCSENSWVLSRPTDGKSISIIALSAKNPWRPNLTVSQIQLALSI